MTVLRVHLRGWTSSFRYPGFAVGVHPTLPMPPLSTIFGLLSAARGVPVTPQDTALGFVFLSNGKATDLEVTYELSGNLEAKSNVTRRDILFEPELFLYLSDLSFADDFRRPHYPLVLGRSTELIQVLETKIVALEKRAESRVGGSLWPFPQDGVSGSLQALPTHFTQDFPRRAVGTKPWLLVERWQDYAPEILCDGEKNWGVWMHGA